MKTLLLLLAFIGNVISYGQGKIKRDITSKGDTLYSTPEKKLYTMPGAKNAIGEIVKSSIYKSNSSFSLCLTIQTGRTSVFSISENDVAEIYFNDGTLLTLMAAGDYNSRRSALDYGCYLFAFYNLGSKALGKLRLQDVEKIHVFASLGKMIYDIKHKQSDIIHKQLLSFE